MFELLKDKLTQVAVEDDQGVREAQVAHTAAVKALLAAEAEIIRLNGIVDGIVRADEVEFFDSRAQLPAARTHALKVKAELAKVSGQLKLVREQAKARLDEARKVARRPLIADVFAKFLEAVEAHEALQEFDRQTTDMGGSDYGSPTPGLNREVFSFQEGLARKDQWL